MIEERKSCNKTCLHINTGERFVEGICFVEADLSNVIQAREHISALCAESGADGDKKFDIMLIVDELIANAVIATYENSMHEDIVIRWQYDNGKFSVGVLDYGGGFDLAQAKRDSPGSSLTKEYFKKFVKYRKDKQVKVLFNGKLTNVERTGKGLSMVESLVGKIDVNYHNAMGDFNNKLSNDVVGSFVKVRLKAEV